VPLRHGRGSKGLRCHGLLQRPSFISP
jgi:hypothetical protein